MEGRSVDEYRAPLFLAWQLTNRCRGRCITCCEESGPDRAWADELDRDESLDLARRIVDAGIPYVAFGGGEPLGVPHCWEIFDILAAARVAIKLETDGNLIDERAADRLAALAVDCVQISLDGATAATHDRLRPGSTYAGALAAVQRLAARGLAPQWVFAPTRFNLHEIGAAYDLAATKGCGAFVSGPLMRLGRAALDWDSIACRDDDWQRATAELQQRARATPSTMALSIYPWDIVDEVERRLDQPQAMLLVVPNGKVKLLNALPFVAADMRRDSIDEAWTAYRLAWRAPVVREFVARCRTEPALLRHANETWTMDEVLPGA